MVNVVLVTFNRKKCLEVLLEALTKQTEAISRVFIYDNNSNDGTEKMLKDKGYISYDELVKDTWFNTHTSKFDVLYIKSSVNSGGSGGFSKVIEKSLEYECDYLWIMDDDVQPEQNCLEILCKGMSEGIHACIPNRTDEYFEDNVWVEFDLKRMIAPGLTSTRKTKIVHPLQKDNYLVKDFPFEGPLIRFETVKKIGPSNASYFIICDDTDYAMQVQKYGKISFMTNATLHRQLAKFDNYSKDKRERLNWKDYYALRNYIIFIKKYGEKWGTRKFNSIFNLVYWNFRAIKSGSLHNIKVINKAIIDGILNRTGKTVNLGSL